MKYIIAVEFNKSGLKKLRINAENMKEAFKKANIIVKKLFTPPKHEQWQSFDVELEETYNNVKI